MDTKVIIIIIIILLVIYFIVNKLIDYNIPMYCIYIPKREIDIKRLFNSYDMNVTFIKGIDKENIDVDELIKTNQITKWNDVNKGRIACHYSHLNVLKEFLQTSEKRCIIFEDDLSIDENLKLILKYKLNKIIKNTSIGVDLLYLGYCYQNCQNEIIVNKYMNKTNGALCRHAYMINRKAAKIILNETIHMYNNGDQMYKNLINNKQINSCVVNSNNILFRQNRLKYGSELNNNPNSPPICRETIY